MFNKVTKSFQYGQHTVVLETGGSLARPPAPSWCRSRTQWSWRPSWPPEGQAGSDLLPADRRLHRENLRRRPHPGGFFKREGKPSEKETLTSRLIDRPLRPLFPEDFYNEVQVVIHTLSVNPEIDPDIAAMIGASAALAISGIPFNGPIGAARVGYRWPVRHQPDRLAAEVLKLDLVVAGTENAVLMVESEADQLSEEVMLGGVVYGHQQMQAVINAIHDLVKDAGKPEWDWQAPAKDEALIAAVTAAAQPGLNAAYQVREKQARTTQLREVYANVSATLNAAAAEGRAGA